MKKIYNFRAYLLLASSFLLFSNYTHSQDNILSMSGYKLGDSCAGNNYYSSNETLQNHKNAIEFVKILRKVASIGMPYDYKLNIKCSLSDNTISKISIGSEKPENIAILESYIGELIERQEDSLNEVELEGFNSTTKSWALNEFNSMEFYEYTNSFDMENKIHWGSISILLNDSEKKDWDFSIKSGLIIYSLTENHEEFQDVYKNPTNEDKIIMIRDRFSL